VVRVTVEGPEGRETLSIPLGQVVSIHSDSISLKDVFLRLTGREFH
jgi:hypothetical protein